MTRYRLRPATGDDLPALAAVNITAWRETYAALLPAGFFDNLETDPHYSLEHWQVLLRRWRALLAEADDRKTGEIAGFVLFGESNGTLPGYDGQIEKLYLRRSAQGAGLGRRLLQSAARALLDQERRSLVIWVIQANEPAQRFYRHLGGIRVGKPLAFEIAGRQFHEIAFGWPDLADLAADR
jgi:ribosomal protein S18 acetylase RimI-like enzyme